MINDFDPQHIAVVWDSKGGSFRNKEYPEYKAHRQAPPDDLFDQKDDIIEVIEAIDMANVAKKGYEADDLIGSIAKNNKGSQTVIVGPDKDLYQFLSKDVIVFDPFKERIIDEETFETERGFPPSKIPFYHALLGDASDNIPGVAGVGKKTAEVLVKQFDSLKDLYNNLDKVKKPRVRLLLEQYKKEALLSLKLFTIKYKGLTLKKSESKFDKNNWGNAAPLFEKLELKRLSSDLKKRFPEAVESKEVQQTLFPQKKKKKWTCRVVTTLEALDDLIAQLKKDKLCGLDTETSGYFPLSDELVGMSFATNTKESFYIPFKHPESDEHPQIDRDVALEKLKPVLESDRVKKTLHAVKFDELVLWNNGIQLQGVVFDSLIAAGLLKKAWEKINLKDLSQRLLNEPMVKFKEVVGTKYKNFSHVPIEDAAQYGAHDAIQTFKLKPVLEKLLKKEPALEKLYKKIEMPLNAVLIKMEKRGILLDPSVLKKIETSVSRTLKTIEKKIFAALPGKHKKIDGEPINLNSPQQIEVLLFDYLKLPQVKKGQKGGRSTDRDVLNELGKVHPVPGLIMSFRELRKLKTTYLEPLPGFINEKTGRVHTSYSQIMTATGRLSSSNPNLQNIPASPYRGVQIRSAFVAPRGSSFLAADYSQIELRILAHMSGDKTLTKVFIDDQDIHTQTAAQLFDVAPDKVTRQQRQIGKRINFSIIYGLTPYGLARELNIKPGEAKEYIDKYFQQYAGVAKWMEKAVQEAQKQGYAQSLWGRRRWIPQLKERNRTRVELGKRLAINTPIQATQADIIKIAMINIDKIFEKKRLKAEIILQIHDELVLEVPKKELDLVEKIVKKEMESVVNWKVPIVVNMETGKNWGKITK